MEIIVADSAGFCFGVKRAIKIASNSAENIDGSINTLGPIIHNPQVVQKLEKESDIYSKSSLNDIDSGTVIIRSHGVPKETMVEAEGKGLNVVDATCPFVTSSQDIVEELVRDGYYTIIVGEKEHPEMIGVLSYGDDSTIVVGSVDELQDMPNKPKIGIIAQTTLPIKTLQSVASYCLTKSPDVKICNTICDATSVRQKESAEVAEKVDCMVVVGGRNSANTDKLTKICKEIQPDTHHIEVASELSSDWFSDKIKIGVTAGASTPDWIIRDVVDRISTFSKERKAS